MTVHKKGLYQAADILEKYRIGSETAVSELEQHDFSMQGLRALPSKESAGVKLWVQWQLHFCWISLTFQKQRW